MTPPDTDRSEAPRTAAVEALDEFLHTPARLSILSLLAPAEWVLFSFLRDTIATSDSALSKQLRALEDAGYVQTHKAHAPRRTYVCLTAQGRTAFESYLASLENLVARARGGEAQREATERRQPDGDAPPAPHAAHAPAERAGANEETQIGVP